MERESTIDRTGETEVLGVLEQRQSMLLGSIPQIPGQGRIGRTVIHQDDFISRLASGSEQALQASACFGQSPIDTYNNVHDGASCQLVVFSLFGSYLVALAGQCER